jgi:hypothetical protein
VDEWHMDATWMDDQFLISCEQRAVWASYFGRESQLVKWIIIITFGAQNFRVMVAIQICG